MPHSPRLQSGGKPVPVRGAPFDVAPLIAALAGVRLYDRARAELNLRSLSTIVPRGVLATLPGLLADSPDPDTALNLFERLCRSAPADVLRMLDRQRPLVHYAITVFGHSQYLGDTLIQNTDLFEAMERGLDRPRGEEDFRGLLARFRTRTKEADLS